MTEDTRPHPLEDYGRAKLQAELLCRQAVEGGLDVTIIRPRTILGHGRLGIMAILFEFVADGAPVFVFGPGDNKYQFVHANDLADACLRAGRSSRTPSTTSARSPSARCARRSGARRPRGHRVAGALVADRTRPGRR